MESRKLLYLAELSTLNSPFSTLKNMRINWGIFIFVIYAGFVGFMGFLIYKTFQPKVDLVSKDYYADELAFQGKIDAKNAANALSAPVTCKLQEGELILSFPPEMQANTFSGTVHIYCEWNAENDKKIPFTNAAQAEVKVTVPTLPKGKYKAFIDWQEQGKNYHIQETIFI